MNPWEESWDTKSLKLSFDDALKAEGVTGKAAEIARSIYQQESSSGKNTKTSNAGAVGGMQIIPATFKSVADKDWSIDDPFHNSRAGIRYVKQLFEQAGGDPALTAAGYYGGPGGLEKARRGVAVSDPRNPNAPDTLQYGRQVAARLGNAITDAVIPSAQAAERPTAPTAKMPWDEEWEAPPVAEKPPASAGDRFVGGVVKGAKDLAGGLVRGAGSIGATLLAPGDAIQDAIAGRPLMTSNRERRTDMDSALESLGADPNSLSYGAGKLTGEVAGTAGVGPALAGGAKALGAGPQAVNALRTSGMTLGPGAAPGAANALTRVAGGAVTGGAAAGLVNPEDALTGAAIGGALPPVVKGLGAAGTALARTVRGPEVPANILSAATQAQKAGYVIPPTQVRPTLTNRILEGASGKLTTAQNASARNQAVTNRLAQSAIGAPELSPEGLQAVRAQANAAYSALGNAGELSADDAFRTALQKVGAPSSKLKQDFPALANKELEGIVDSFSNTKNFDAQSAIEAIKELRAAQRAGLGSQDPAIVAMARAKGKISDALEDLVERNLTAKGNTDLLNAYREARQTLAKVYDVEKAMNPATGNVDARKLGNLLKKGRLTGDLKTAAEFAQSFKTAAQPVEQMGSLPQTSPLDWHAMGAASLAAGNPLPMLGVAGRPAARAMALSGPVQRGLTRPRNALSLSLDENALLPLYRGGPLLATDR